MSAAELDPDFGRDLPDGFRVTNSWLAQGNGWLDDIQLFYRERALIENDYAAKLSSLARQYLERKASKSSALSVGKAPAVTPGSLESASMTTWGLQLQALETQSAKHKQFATDIQTQLADPLKSLQAQCETLRQVQVAYAKKLEDEKTLIETDVRKQKSKYDSACEEVEYRRKKADGDGGKGKASAAFQQQLAEMHDTKNAYLLGITVANAQQEKYYLEYLAEVLSNLQEISESRVSAVNDIWTQAAKLELSTLKDNSDLLRNSLAEIPRNDPKLDMFMFIQHNQIGWQMPPALGFEPSPVWHDEPLLIVDERAKNFLRNSLTRSKATRVEKRSQANKLKQELQKARAAMVSARGSGPVATVSDGEATESTKMYFLAQERLHEASLQLVSAETEIKTITDAIGDISLGALNHPFKPDTFKIPTACDFCGDKIWGLSGAKGAICTDCGFTCHTKCELKSPANCPGPQNKDERKKLKQERQDAITSGLQALPEASSAAASSVATASINLTQRSSTPTSFGQRDRSPSIRSNRTGHQSTQKPTGSNLAQGSSSPKESPVPPAKAAPPPAAAAASKPKRRILAPEVPDLNGIRGFSSVRIKGKALYSYEANGPGQITVRENDDIVMIEADDNSGWVKVKCNLSTGLVPKSYVSLESSSGSSPALPSRPPGHTRGQDSVGSIGKRGPPVAPRPGGKKVSKAKALYDYDAADESAHSIVEGEELILVKLDAAPGWSHVEKNGQVKYVPRDYITEV